MNIEDVLNCSPIGAVITSAGNSVVYANQSFCEMLGYSHNELLSLNYIDILHPQDVDTFRVSCMELRDGESRSIRIFKRYKSKSGVFIPVAYWASIVKENEGNGYLIVGQATEMNDSISGDFERTVLQETELQEKTSILNAITSKLPVVIYRYSKQDGISSLDGNQDLIRYFARSKMVRLTVEETLMQVVGKVSSFKDYQGYLHFSSSNSDDEEEVYFDNFVFESGKPGEFIGLALDVTERRRSELNLKRNTRTLEKVNKELNQFAYIVSHDLKAPLRAIINLSDWIEEDLKGLVKGEVKKNLTLLRGRVQRMENLINGILMYSRISRTTPVYDKLDTANVIRETIESLEVPDNFTIKISAEIPQIVYSKVDLERIIINLVSNAVMYHDKKKGIIEIDYREEGGYHVFSVADDGPGIAPEYHEKIFKIFQTLNARDALESTGIGLSIVRKIVEERGGSVRVNAASGNGAEFIFTIPKNPGKEEISEKIME